MKKRFLAFLLAVCVAVSMLVLPASAVGSNAAVQTATALGGLTAEQAGSLGAPLTRGQAARLLTAFSAYRDTTTAQGRTGRLYSDVDSDSPYAVYIRTAVQNGWMTGYSDGSFRPDNTVTLEEACTMALRLLGYDVAKLGGTFPTAQLSKASALGLRNEINARQGETLTLEQGTMLFYNALTAMNGSGQVYASTLGFAVSNGQVDISSVLLDNVKGPFVADASTVLPFAPAAIYRNDEVTTSAALSPYDVYYYNESARTVWLYNKRAAGRVTAVSPSASAPTSVTVAGVTYAIASPSVAYQLSSLSGGGVGQVVTLLLGMNDAAVSVLTGDAADAVFYGVVQSSSRERPHRLALQQARRRPRDGCLALGQRSDLCDRGRRYLRHRFALCGLSAVLPVRRRRGPGGHSAAGHERCSCLRPHRRRGRRCVLRRGPVLIPHPRGDEQR